MKNEDLLRKAVEELMRLHAEEMLPPGRSLPYNIYLDEKARRDAVR
jgi:DNA gyrase inhibitor GyrI